MQTSNILVHYAEIATKGKNRPHFVGRLISNIRDAMAQTALGRIDKVTGRLWLRAKEGQTFDDEALARLRTVYGISSYSPAVETSLDLDEIKRCGMELVRDRTYETFRVSARRAFKHLPWTSLQLNLEVGNYILERKPAKVRLHNADVELHIEVVPGAAYLYVDKRPGLGGLPVGISGRGCLLLSGGIDSPVAAFRMQRRGLRMVFVHFHSHPFQSRASQDKAIVLAEHLACYQSTATLYLVPFGELQREIVTGAPPALRVVLYRRFMLRIAGVLARREKAKALVTGEVVGQVASQTLDNMVVIDRAASIPVLRPLIGFDKQEIIDQAEALGTFETSVIPDQDCCQLFMPKHPETHARLDEVEALEAALELDELCKKAIDTAERKMVAAPWVTVGEDAKHIFVTSADVDIAARRQDKAACATKRQNPDEQRSIQFSSGA